MVTPVVTTDVAGSDALPEPTFVPVLGRIAAGGPILAEEAVEDVFPLPRELVGEGSLFLLKVVGESMIDAAICDGDWVVVRQQNVADNGDIVAAMIDGEATVKTFKRTRGQVWLMPHNPAVRPDPRQRRGHPGQGRHRPPQAVTVRRHAARTPSWNQPRTKPFVRANSSLANQISAFTRSYCSLPGSQYSPVLVSALIGYPSGALSPDARRNDV